MPIFYKFKCSSTFARKRNQIRVICKDVSVHFVMLGLNSQLNNPEKILQAFLVIMATVPILKTVIILHNSLSFKIIKIQSQTLAITIWHPCITCHGNIKEELLINSTSLKDRKNQAIFLINTKESIERLGFVRIYYLNFICYSRIFILLLIAHVLHVLLVTCIGLFN